MKSQADTFTSDLFNPARDRSLKKHSRTGAKKIRGFSRRKKDDVKKALMTASQLFRKNLNFKRRQNLGAIRASLT